MSNIFQNLVRDTDGVLALEAGSGPIADPLYSQGLPITSAGAVHCVIDGVIDYHVYGLPFDADGRMVVSADAISYFDQSLPFTVDGALSASDSGGVAGYSQGLAIGAGGAMFVSGLIPPLPEPMVWEDRRDGLNSGSSAYKVNAITPAGNGVWVAVLSNGWAARSDDDGVTWSALTQGLYAVSTTNINDVASDMDGTLIAVKDAGFVARSTDYGVTWVELTRNLGTGNSSNDFHQIQFSNGAFIVLGEAGSATRSTDGGDTWTNLPTFFNSGLAAFEKMRIGHDGAEGWMAVYDSDHNAVSTDNGVTWTAFTRSFISGTSGGAAGDGSVWVHTVGNSIFRSTDNGASWTEVASGLTLGAGNTYAGVFTDRAGNYVVSGQSGAYTSGDNGLTWTHATDISSFGARNPRTDYGGIWHMPGVSNGWSYRSPPV